MFVNKKIIKELIDMYSNWKNKNLTINSYNTVTDKYIFSKVTYIGDSIDAKKNGNIVDFSFYGRYKWLLMEPFFNAELSNAIFVPSCSTLSSV